MKITRAATLAFLFILPAPNVSSEIITHLPAPVAARPSSFHSVMCGCGNGEVTEVYASACPQRNLCVEDDGDGVLTEEDLFLLSAGGGPEICSWERCDVDQDCDLYDQGATCRFGIGCTLSHGELPDEFTFSTGKETRCPLTGNKTWCLSGQDRLDPGSPSSLTRNYTTQECEDVCWDRGGLNYAYCHVSGSSYRTQKYGWPDPGVPRYPSTPMDEGFAEIERLPHTAETQCRCVRYDFHDYKCDNSDSTCWRASTGEQVSGVCETNLDCMDIHGNAEVFQAPVSCTIPYQYGSTDLKEHFPLETLLSWADENTILCSPPRCEAGECYHGASKSWPCEDQSDCPEGAYCSGFSSLPDNNRRCVPRGDSGMLAQPCEVNSDCAPAFDWEGQDCAFLAGGGPSYHGARCSHVCANLGGFLSGVSSPRLEGGASHTGTCPGAFSSLLDTASTTTTTLAPTTSTTVTAESTTTTTTTTTTLGPPESCSLQRFDWAHHWDPVVCSIPVVRGDFLEWSCDYRMHSPLIP